MKKYVFIILIMVTSCSGDDQSNCISNLPAIENGPSVKSHVVSFVDSNINGPFLKSYEMDRNNRIVKGNGDQNLANSELKYEYNRCNLLSRVYNDSYSGVNYEYNDNGLIERFYDTWFSFRFEYTGNSVIRREYRGNINNDGSGGLFNDANEFTFDENGNVVKIETIRRGGIRSGNYKNLEYDSKGNIKRMYSNQNSNSGTNFEYHNEKNPLYNVILKTFGSKKNTFLIEYSTGYRITDFYLEINPNILKNFQIDGSFNGTWEYEITEKTNEDYAEIFYLLSPDLDRKKIREHKINYN